MTGPIRDVESAVRELGALPVPAGAAPLPDSLLADFAALDFTDLMDADSAAVIDNMRDLLVGEIQRLRAELAKYVGQEPTVAEGMAYISGCLDAVRNVCDEAEKQATRWENPLPVSEWVAVVRKAANGGESR
ncbi:hypothetical protein [Streptomyces sp. NBC_01614]|uniref:hypothetical protein n=1 Tax=Streptomyces sp. NBC_01614 TaxID=2975897 RepID=UPI0038643DD8